MRIFIAVELEDKLKESIGEIQKKLICVNADVKWVKTGNFHLTLKFIGETGAQAVGRIIETLDANLKSCRPHGITIENIGVFPSEISPNIIWAGVGAGKDDICGLAQLVEEKLSAAGFAGEKRKFLPHMTLGRVRSKRNIKELLGLIKSINGISAGGMDVTGVSLMQSRFMSGGAVYSRIKRFELCG